MSGRLIAGSAEGTWRGAALDSRRVAGGELFFALRGERTDGHRFVADARARGASAAVVEHPVELGAGGEGFPLIEVVDGLAALHALTRRVRERTPERLVAITGSAGKTTTKEILATLLAARHRVAASPGNYNNLYGFPLALLGIPGDTEWMVAEMAMSTPGELAGVSRLGRPDVAVFTNVRAAHLEAFERAGRPAAVRTIGEAKAELLEGLEPDGLVIANAADPEVVRIAERHRGRGGRVVWFALDLVAAVEAPRLEVRGLSAGRLADGRFGSTFDLVDRERGGVAVAVDLPLHGEVNVENFLAAATCAVELGISLEQIADQARALGPRAGRGRVHALAEPVPALVVDDSYNSNPDALARALKAAVALPGSRHWAVLGEMLELGSAARELHRRSGEGVAACGIDLVVGVGELARELIDAARAQGVPGEWFADAGAAAPWCRGALRPGDVVLVKGSRGVRLERVVEALLGSTTDDGGGA
ncbi:MAG TPA: UDP-N-acetylmuramoyl-tripeptide--D-alanyl-D-alanine ligase [Thermoanaerobaculia bacterium]|nr:UDP-N-acetylmuramoyl-tripeptide--D-alanyl-D-alanine ligase [Thermoanaerobaculia bacterium]